MDRRMVFNHYRFFISCYVTSYLSVMAVTFILDVVIDGVVCNLMGRLGEAITCNLTTTFDWLNYTIVGQDFTEHGLRAK